MFGILKFIHYLSDIFLKEQLNNVWKQKVKNYLLYKVQSLESCKQNYILIAISFGKIFITYVIIVSLCLKNNLNNNNNNDMILKV